LGLFFPIYGKNEKIIQIFQTTNQYKPTHNHPRFFQFPVHLVKASKALLDGSYFTGDFEGFFNSQKLNKKKQGNM